MSETLDTSHLMPETVAFLHRPQAERIAEIRRDHWVGYPRAKEALKQLDDLLTHPRTTRMPNLLLVGPSGIGKTTIIERFEAMHPVTSDAEGGPIMPVLSVNMTTVPSEAQFWPEMLNALCVSYRETRDAQRLKRQALEVMRMNQCRMVIIDEIHNLLTGGPREQRTFLVLLKNLSNQLGVPLVCVGTADAVRALATDTQLASRFTSFGLRKLPLDKSFQAFLKSYERRLPLEKPSRLIDRDITAAIHRGSNGGVIADVTKMLRDAAVMAVRSGEERITLQILKELPQLRISDPGADGGLG